jgi:uncharacterized protein (DUF952 family)
MPLMADEPIYHITSRDEWQSAQTTGAYRAESLDTQGFIHASTRAQVVETADLFYRRQDGLVLLCIDESKLTAPVKREAPTGSHREAAGPFPHIYGPLNLDAVVQVLDFPCRVDGTFELPAALRDGNNAARRDPVTQATHMTEETAQKLLLFLESSEPVRRIRASQLATGVLGAVGFALFVVGVERAAEDIPVVSNAWGSIGVGFLLLAATGLLLRKLSGGGE